MVLYEKLFRELHVHRIEYLVAGGFAVNFHQVQRATVDLDLVLHLTRDNIERFVSVMEKLGYHPRLPVNPLDLADEIKRRQWMKEKNMTVFSFFNPTLTFETIDLFVEEPRPFDELYSRKKEISAFGVTIPVVGIDDLIAMKKSAGRDKDLYDITQLKKLKKDPNR